MLHPSGPLAALLGVSSATLLRLVSAANGFHAGNCMRGGPPEIRLRSLSGQVLFKWSNASGLLLTFKGMV